MLVFDQLKKSEPQLRALAMVILSGLLILLGGLWWVQIVSARDYRENLETQSIRTVRIPAVRGKILDRNGVVLAENRPIYDICLYLEDLRRPFEKACSEQLSRARKELKARADDQAKQLHRRLTSTEKKEFTLSAQDKELLRQKARYGVASNVVFEVGQRLQQPLSLNADTFRIHYEKSLALPFTIVTNATSAQIARFEEQCTSPLGVDVEVQTTRIYPFGTLAAHLLGCVQRDDSSAEGEEAYFSYRLPDYRGSLGIEWGYDKELRGTAGAKSVLVNNLGYRQTENVWSPAEPGQNVVLTVDQRIQQAAERALPIFGPGTMGAAVVMDVESGDVLALASAPAFNPNYYIRPSYYTNTWPAGEAERLTDPEKRPQRNRATQEIYEPGSIFKTIVALACLENGLDPNETIYNPGYIFVGKRHIRDLAPAGNYDLLQALAKSSNTYFITNGLKAGISNIVRITQPLHLSETFGLPTRQDHAGIFPNARTISSLWYDGHTANICIGQGEMAVTPLQMAVMTAAIANGGKVLWPRLVARLESQDPASGEPPASTPAGRIRDELQVSTRSLEVVREAMLADVEKPGGTGVRAAVPGLAICGKTGTAQVTKKGEKPLDHTTWFISFAPYKQPRYAVVVMVEGGSSGGGDCAPVASYIYRALLQRGFFGNTNQNLAKAN
jgi:penicillin-binding protein 2